MFLPLKQCIEILGASLQPRSAQAILEQCLQGITQKVPPTLLLPVTNFVACWNFLDVFRLVADPYDCIERQTCSYGNELVLLLNHCAIVMFAVATHIAEAL